MEPSLKLTLPSIEYNSNNSEIKFVKKILNWALKDKYYNVKTTPCRLLYKESCICT